MSSKSSATPFRVFGSPYTLALHQQVTYLRLKQVPFKVYCTNITTTIFYSIFYRARHAFCTLTPSGVSRLQVWQLAETAELDEDVEAISRGAKGEVPYATLAPSPTASSSADTATSSTAAAPRTQQIIISRETHPNLHLACWCFVVYSCWWLAKTGAMYRYVRGESLDVLEGYMRYFFLFPGFGLARTAAPAFRESMKRITTATGASDLTAPYMDEHFTRFCTALEAHLREHPSARFLLDTPHPTLADVTLGATFSSFFLMDDPPSSMLAEKFPCVTEYAERVTGWRGTTFVNAAEGAADAAAGSGDVDKGNDPKPTTSSYAAAACEATEDSAHDTHIPSSYPDVVPESLASCFELIAEVFPFLMSQCASFNAFMASNGVRTLKREPLEREWRGCHGYLLPQLTNIKSLMIIDNDISTVLARAQDLEVAFLASREVFDDALRHFGRHDDGDDGEEEEEEETVLPSSPQEKAKRPEEPTAIAAAVASAPSPSAEEAASTSSGASTTNTVPRANDGVVSQVTEEDGANTPADAAAKNVSENLLADDALGGSADTASPASATSVFDRATDVNTMEADDADFYRAFTEAGRLRLGGTATSLATVVPSARHATNAGTSALTMRSSVMERLETLRRMLAKMSCPQYTLTSVFHGRRMYVAVIPEYEVAKVRRARRAAAKAARMATAAAERAPAMQGGIA